MKTSQGAWFVSWLVFIVVTQDVQGFSTALFQSTAAQQKTMPSSMQGVDIELPDFDELFGRIQQVSPLARQVILERGSGGGFSGLEVCQMDLTSSQSLPWKTIESNKRKVPHQIEKIDGFCGHPAPIYRFRGSFTGPCEGQVFANFIMDLEERKKWDPQIEQVFEIYPSYDLDMANIAMGFGRYGDCSRLGVGYCRTKANLGISGREQLTLCGIQNFVDGSCIIWGTEMEDWHNHLLPTDQERTTRAKSHIFCTTLTPTSPETFDVEYVLQLEIGGNLPAWLTNSIMLDTIKKLFRTADTCYQGKCSTLETYLKEQVLGQEALILDRQSLLMTP